MGPFYLVLSQLNDVKQLMCTVAHYHEQVIQGLIQWIGKYYLRVCAFQSFCAIKMESQTLLVWYILVENFCLDQS